MGTKCRITIGLFLGVIFALLATRHLWANPIVPNEWYDPFNPDINPERYGTFWQLRLVGLVMVVFIESFVIMAMTRKTFLRSLAASTLINVVSAVSGFIIAFPDAFFHWTWALLVLVILGSVYVLRKWKFPAGYLGTIVATVVVGILGLWMLWNYSITPESSALYGGYEFAFLAIFLALGLALAVEPLVFRFYYSARNAWKVMLWANGLTYLFIFLMSLLSTPGFFPFVFPSFFMY
jgi:hypothetical protein